MSQKNKNDDPSPEFEPEFSRPVDVTSFGSKGRYFKFQATDKERYALASRYSVLSVGELDVECRITPAGKMTYKLNAEFKTKITQACGVSLEPVDDKIACKFTMTLRQSPGQKHKKLPEIDFNPEEEDTEILISNLIDVGEMIAQYLSLEINPYPRLKNVTGKELGQNIVQEDDMLLDNEKKNPFAALKSLKHKT